MKHSLKIFLHKVFIKYPKVGWYGYELMRHLKSDKELKFFLRKLKTLGYTPDVILDVGANRGEWTQFVKSIFPSSTYYLIEPQEEMEPFLRRVCDKVQGKAKYFIAGAGDKKGELELAVWDDFAGTSFKAVESEVSSQMEKRIVPIVTIDGLVDSGEMEIPNLMKVDVQGFEIEVLKGAISSLSSCEVVILEISLFKFFPSTPIVHEVIGYMESVGYVMYEILNKRNRPYDNALGQIDVCFVKKDGYFRQSNAW